MEPTLQTRALVLRAERCKENDRLLTALTEGQGVVRAFANGAEKPKSHLHGACQPYAYGTYELRASRRGDAYTVADAHAEGLFFAGLAGDVSRLALANYFSALCAALCPQGEPACAQLRLALNALHLLARGARPQRLLKAALELRLLCLAGYAPDLTGAGDYLDCAGGVLAAAAGRGRAPLPPPALEAMRHICAAPMEKLFRFALPQEQMNALSFAAAEYLTAQLGRKFTQARYWEDLEKSV